MNVSLRLPALSAACAAFLLAIAANPAAAEEGPTGDAIHAMSRDNPTLIRAALGKLKIAPPPSRTVTELAQPAKLDTNTIDAMPAAAGGEDLKCLAEAIYFESRGEPLDGQIAVAEVVLNRVDDRRFPSSVCGVTRQGAGSGRGCQFSYACDGRPDVMKSAGARERSEKLAGVMLQGRPRTVTDGATYFHTRGVRPSWAGKMQRTASIGHHYFYRPGSRVASN
jgi:spore germination cell wall hydrolase CwlJ-like protein